MPAGLGKFCCFWLIASSACAAVTWAGGGATPTGRSGRSVPPRGPIIDAPASNPSTFTEALKARLNSPIAAERQAAQESLQALLNDPELVRKLAESVSDPQLAALLKQRVDQLATRPAPPTAALPANPGDLPNISLNVANARLTDMVDALNLALNSDNKIVGTSMVGSFTLNVKDKPFWEVFTALQAQQPMSILSSTRFQVSPTSAAAAALGGRTFAIDGPVIMYVTAMSYRRTMNLQAMPEPVPSSDFMIAFQQAVDPRLGVAAFGPLAVSKMVDNEGHEIASVTANTGTANGTFARTVSVQMTPPPRLGKTISFMVDSTVESTTANFVLAKQISDVKQHVNERVAIPGGTVTVAQFDDAGGQIQMRIAVLMTSLSLIEPSMEAPRASCTLLDVAGNTVWTGSVSGGISTLVGGGAGGPYRLNVRVPGAGGRKVHFEFKNIALP